MNPPPAPVSRFAHARHGLWLLLSPVLWMLLALLLVLGLAGGGMWWLLRSEAGSVWLLSHAPGVQMQGLRGAILSSRWEFDRLHIDIGGGLKSITIENAVAEGLEWSWHPQKGVWLGVHARRVAARSVELAFGTSKSPGPPSTIGSPLQAVIDSIEVDRFVIGSLAPATNVRARGTVSARNGSVHRIDDIRFTWDQVSVEASGDIGCAPPFALDVKGRLERPGAGAWSASASALGPLKGFRAQATLRGSAGGANAPSLDLDATIASFAPWPIAQLKASIDALDLAALASALPSTRLSGTADVQSSSIEAPVAVDIRLSNQLPGRWDQRRLPLASARVALRADLRQHEQLDIGSFELQLAGGSGATGAAGLWRGTGTWRGDVLRLQTQLSALRPQGLDQRAPAAQLSGPLNLTITELRGHTPTLQLQGELEGRLDAKPVPVKLLLDGDVTLAQNAPRLLLRQLRASAGNAVALLSGDVQPAAGGGWLLKTTGSLTDFDPVLWWPGAEGSAWRQGPHHLSAGWQLDLRLPANAAQLAPVLLAQSVAGSGAVRVHESMIAGVPLQLELTLAHQPQGAPAARGEPPSSLHAELRVAGNRLVLDGRGDPLGAGLADRYRAELGADALAALAPLARLFPELAEWAPREGRLSSRFTAEGRWPDMRSQGEATLQQMRLGELSVGQGRLDWRFDTGSNQPVDAHLDARQLRWDRQSLDSVVLDLQGTLRQHAVKIDAVLPLRPPEWTEALLGLRTGNGTRARLRADGAWLSDGAGGGSWRGRVDGLQIGAVDNSNPAAAASAASATAGTASTGEWLDARDLRAELRFSPAGGMTELRAEAGRARIARDLQLRWDEFRLDNRGAERPDFELRAQIEPFLAAPMLARLQPTLGWGGDLRLAARLDIKAAQRFAADVVFEREAGDLSIDDVAGRQALGLQSLRLALNAQDGRWTFQQALAGRILGEIKGQQTLRVAPEQRWPDAQAPLEGRIEARVGTLGIWGSWVPPGWRLAGSLQTQATISGRLGAPAYTGRLEGRGLAVSNLLQGVDVRDGEVDVSLQGERATIERFTARGGDGRVELRGGAEFGAAPVARVQLEAQRFRVLGRADRQLITSGKAALELRAESLKLDGALKVDEGLFDVSRSDAPSLDDDVVLRNAAQQRTEAEAADSARTPRRNTQVAVEVDLGDKLRVRGRGLETLLGGQLRVTTPGGRLAINGQVRTDGGTYAAYAQKLDIARGILLFNGPPDNPGLDILALRPNIDARVGVAITGSFVSPRVRLFSDPEMSDTDKLSWLVLGRPSDGLGRADTALLQRAALALLAGEGEAPTDAFLRTLGIDEISLRQSDGEVRETVITLGKQLSRRWYVGYERGVNAATGTWQLVYRIAQRFTLRAQSGHENSLDVIWTWRVGEGEKR